MSLFCVSEKAFFIFYGEQNVKNTSKTINPGLVNSFYVWRSPEAMAMQSMEGYLPASFCLMWALLCLPFLALSVFKIKQIVQRNRKILLLLAMAGAYVFVLSALKIPSVTGSSSHPTGTGLGAILFGPAPMALIGFIALLFQAILLAHGGLTTLGANTFSMAIVGPFVCYAAYKLCLFLKLKRLLAVFAGATLGSLCTYCLTSWQLALAFPSESGGVLASALKFMTIFALTQAPLSVIEGLLTVVVIMGLESFAAPELSDLGY